MPSIAVALFERVKHVLLVSNLGRRFARGALWNLAG